jgi:hypothetical protein
VDRKGENIPRKEKRGGEGSEEVIERQEERENGGKGDPLPKNLYLLVIENIFLKNGFINVGAKSA